MSENIDESSLLIEAVLEGVFEKQGENVVKMDMRKLEKSVCDYFIICHAQSNTQVDSIAESVLIKAKTDAEERPFHKEGMDNCLWVLLDYGNVIVHVFTEEYRKLYNLEGLWADAEITNVQDERLK